MTEETYGRPGLAVALYLGGLALGLGPAAASVAGAPLLAWLVEGALVVGLGFACLMAAGLGGAGAFLVNRDAFDVLGRRAASAGMLAAISASALTWCLGIATLLFLLGGPAHSVLRTAAASVVAAGAALLALRQPGAPVRIILTLGAFVFAVGVLFGMRPPASVFFLALVPYVLLQAWTRVPPTEPDQEEPSAS